ncbi:hypothetical protein SAMN05421780_103261 [Flexibacter flexilis DSM 6793]|uniref:Site-specific recombinase XerD n=1 Tax=Flexibacter flexilis DSM 6793 TaxID=927664 RepID=A0A1I1H8X5_9BACT|nr:hypothetical protein [Flexibacter flexilis]SFC20609.1 hypothetical protein SAMN05421780_103261 [Flexibacter flexilis DSM 6793]
MKVLFWFRDNQTDKAKKGVIMATVQVANSDGQTVSSDFASTYKVHRKDYHEGGCEKEKRALIMELEAIQIFLNGQTGREVTAPEIKAEYLRRKPRKTPIKPKPIAESTPTLQNKPTTIKEQIQGFMQKQAARSIKNSTKANYAIYAKKIISLIGDLPVQEITVKTLENLYYSLSTEKSNLYAIGVITMLKAAIRPLLIDFKIPEPNRQKPLTFLEQSELEKIAASREALPEHLHPACDYFLFLCETGLSLIDFENFKERHKIINHDGILFLEGTRHKTGKTYFVPLSERAQAIGEAYQWQFEFSNRVTLRNHIRAIAQFCGIEKRITPHKARHTVVMNILDQTGDITLAAATIGDDVATVSKHYGQLRVSGYAKMWEKYKKNK